MSILGQRRCHWKESRSKAYCVKAQKYSETGLEASSNGGQRAALIMTTTILTRVPTPTADSERVSTRGEMVEEHIAACSSSHEVLRRMRYDHRGCRQPSPAPCPKHSPARHFRRYQLSACDSRRLVVVPGPSASIVSRPTQPGVPQWSLHTQLSANSSCASAKRRRVAAKLA